MNKGFSFQINGGKYGGFYFRPSKTSIRLCLGWIALTIFFFDVEPTLHEVIEIRQNSDKYFMDFLQNNSIETSESFSDQSVLFKVPRSTLVKMKGKYK